MNLSSRILTAAALCFAVVIPASAQSAHYPAGVEGLKAASLPPPGVYLRDYNYFYSANEYAGLSDLTHGALSDSDFDLFAYVQAPRLIYISPLKVLGGYLGGDVLIPIVYQDVTLGPSQQDGSGLGDVFMETTLSWHGKQYDVGVGYGFWAPTGGYDPMDPSLPGKGYWTQMATAGATVYFDAEKLWSLSLLNRYEINMQNESTGTSPGDVWTLEYGLGRTFNKTIDVGLVGYYVLQTTKDQGRMGNDFMDQAFGIGPEINVFWPQITLFTSLRYVYEVYAQDRPQGQTLNLTLTKVF